MEFLTDVKQEQQFLTISIAYFGKKFRDELREGMYGSVDIVKFDELRDLETYIRECPLLHIPEVIFLEMEDDMSAMKQVISRIRANPVAKGISIILLSFKGNKNLVIQEFRPLVSDIYFYPFNVSDLKERLKFILRFKLIRNETAPPMSLGQLGYYKMPLAKRSFDIVFSLLLILACSPILLLIAILIKLDSKGPVFYVSKRAGSGYKIFNFYKFRSMRESADSELASLSSLNQYASDSAGETAAFIKIANDPRITKFGSFLRNTSLDELPQLFNVLKGDMSLVGNRPLPLYEARMLTSDEWASRFLGPAGITGLWQISKRGRREMSDCERRKLDNFYTEKFSFWMDLKIILKTIPALIQKEHV